jgi:phospholipid/cholesterol/gamma-HCH transport system permease protein
VRALQLAFGKLGRATVQTLAGVWCQLHFAAFMLALALSPATYDRPRRSLAAQQIWLTCWRVLPWFAALSTLISLVLVRVVVATAASYGLSQYAIGMLVRVLVIELIPLGAALFVALRLGGDHELAATAPHCESLDAWRRLGIEALRNAVVPRVVAAAFAVWLLAALSSVIALFLAYGLVYGLSPWGLPVYTRTVGQVFDPAIAIGFALKTVLFGWAVALIPITARLQLARSDASAAPGGMVALFVVLLLIETGSLAIQFL